MTDDSPAEAEVGPWAVEKLEALQRYLDYFTKVLKNQKWQTIFIDAFAGGGTSRVRSRRDASKVQGNFFEGLLGVADPEQAQLIEGSPRRSLEIANPFDSYIFVDADPVRVRMLEQLKSEYPQRRITVRSGSAAAEIDWVLSYRPSRTRHRGVAFLDPFGAHLEWRSVAALAKTGVFEVLINFPLDMCINRLMKVDGQIPAKWRAQLDAFFPDGWWEQAYISDPGILADMLPEVSGDDFLRKRADARDRLLAFYCEHLRSVFGFVSEPKLITNTRGHPLYYLIWAGSHPAGLKGANHVLSMGKRKIKKRS